MQTTLRRGYVNNYPLTRRKLKSKTRARSLSKKLYYVGEFLIPVMIFVIGAAFYILAYCFM